MVRSDILLAFSLALISACAHRGAASNVEGIRASYVWGPEVNTMQPCGSDSTFWVVASSEIIERLRAAQESLGREAYDRLFIRVIGTRLTRPTDGFAESTNGYFEVVELLEIRRLEQGECS